MNLLNKLTHKNLRLNKKRTIVTIIGIMLSVALLAAVSIMYASGLKSIELYEIAITGNFHVEFKDVEVSDLKTFDNNESIEKYSVTKDIGYAKIKSENKNKPYVFLKAYGKEALDNIFVKMEKGRLPKNDSEVVIPSTLLTNGRNELTIGDKITLAVGERYSNDGEKLDQSTPYFEGDEETIKEKFTKEYTVVGISGRQQYAVENYDAPGYTFITYRDSKTFNGKVDVFVEYKREQLKDIEKYTSAILGVDEELYNKIYGENGARDYQDIEKAWAKYEEQAKYEINTNGYLIELQKDPIQGTAMGDLSKVVAIVLAIIVVTSVFCIKNSFDISITEKTKQYGMLRSIGATKKQIRKNVLYEATILGAIGIPLGLLLGIIASVILVFVSNALLGDAFVYDFNLVFAFNPLAIVVTIILGLVTIYLSALKSAFKASRVSPIESIRNSANIKIKRNSLKTPKTIKRLFGIGGDISFKNMKRNKKKYRTTIISIVISTAVFIGLTSFIQYGIEAVKQTIGESDYNLMAELSPESASKVDLNEIKHLSGIEEITISRENIIYLENNSVKFTKEYADVYGDEIKLLQPTVEVIGLEEDAFKNYIKKLNNYSLYLSSVIMVDQIQMYDGENDKNVKIDMYDVKQGDNFTMKSETLINGSATLKIDYVTNTKPFGYGKDNEVLLIVNMDKFNEIMGNNYGLYIRINTNDANKTQDELEIKTNKDYAFLSNKDENVKQMSNMILLIAIFLYGFIIVITLIGITNIFNTITSNIALRRPEFAMLKSIGMTKKEFKNMIRLESLFIGAKSLVFSIPIGIGLSYLVYQAFGSDEMLDYIFPIQSILIGIVCVMLLISVIMNYSVKKTENQNIIETIRNENI